MVRVTPNAVWPHATAGHVEDGNPPNKILDNVPIVYIHLCDADLIVNKSEFPRGVVILNDHPAPFNTKTEEIPLHPGAGDPRQVHITANVAWPTGFVVLW